MHFSGSDILIDSLSLSVRLTPISRDAISLLSGEI